MGKLRLGYMIIWAPGLTMMHLDGGALECSTVLMEAGKSIKSHILLAISWLFLFLFFVLIISAMGVISTF